MGFPTSNNIKQDHVLLQWRKNMILSLITKFLLRQTCFCSAGYVLKKLRLGNFLRAQPTWDWNPYPLCPQARHYSAPGGGVCECSSFHSDAVLSLLAPLFTSWNQRNAQVGIRMPSSIPAHFRGSSPPEGQVSLGGVCGGGDDESWTSWILNATTEHAAPCTVTGTTVGPPVSVHPSACPSQPEGLDSTASRAQPKNTHVNLWVYARAL